MAGGPSSRVRYLIVPLYLLINRFRLPIFLLSLLSLSFLPLLKENNFILTHSLLSESSISRVSDSDISFSRDIQSILEANLAEIYEQETALLGSKAKPHKTQPFGDYSEFISYRDISNGDMGVRQGGNVPLGYIKIAERILLHVDNADIFFHKYLYEKKYSYSIFIILKCKRCVPYFSNLAVATMDKDSTLAASLLLGVMSSLADKPFLSQNHYYLLVPKQVKFGRAVSAFLDSYNSDTNLSFQKHQIHLSHVLDFDNNCTNTISLHYEGLNGYKPPLDWSVAGLNELIRHGIDIQTLPLWESIRRQTFNIHLHELHSLLMEHGIPSFTIAGKCSKNQPYTRRTLLKAFHVLSRDQGNMDESMDECINYYTFTSNKTFIPLPVHLIPSGGLIAIALLHVLGKSHARNPRALFYGFIFYILNVVLMGLIPYLTIANKFTWNLLNKALPIDKNKRAHMAMAYLVITFFLTYDIDSLVTSNFDFKFQVFDKTDKMEERIIELFNKIQMILNNKLNILYKHKSFNKIIIFLEKINKIYKGIRNAITLAAQSLPINPSIIGANAFFSSGAASSSADSTSSGVFKTSASTTGAATSTSLITSGQSSKITADYEYRPSGGYIGLKTALDVSARLFCLSWIIATLFYNPAQALWLILVLFVPLISPIFYDESKLSFNWKFCFLAYYVHIVLLYLPLPKFLKHLRIVYIIARNSFFMSLSKIGETIPLLPKNLLEILKFYGNGGFYQKTTSCEPLTRLASIANCNNTASFEFAVNLFLLYPFWFVILWLNLPRFKTFSNNSQ